MLRKARGRESRVQFARKLGLSYTFVRAMEHGQRFPSDRVLMDIAQRLDLNPDEFLLAAWCDRSPGLDKVLRERGIHLPCGVDEEVMSGVNGSSNGHELNGRTPVH